MLITRTSIITGKVNTIDLPITDDQLSLWQDGEYAQVAFSNLTPAQREFIMTGITGDEWESEIGNED